MTSRVWTQTSPSGCHSGSCGQPTSASSSGKRRSITPSSSASANPIDGRRARSSSFSISPQTRSAGRSSSGIVRHSATVSADEAELEPRRELQRAQHAQAVVAEGDGIDRAQQPALEIGAAVEGILVGAGQWIPRDRVDGEVAPARRLAQRQRGIAGHGEALVPPAGLRLPPRQRHVHVRDLVDGEAFADDVHAAEGAQDVLQAIRVDAEDLDVDVFRRMPHQAIADPSADDQRAAARARTARAIATAVSMPPITPRPGPCGSRNRCSGTTDRSCCARPSG